MPARTVTLTPASKNGTAARAVKVVLYARVSSKYQEKEGFSIPAQLRLLRDYATNQGFVIVQEFTDVETAKASGRTNFNQMLLYLKSIRRCAGRSWWRRLIAFTETSKTTRP